MRVGSLFSGIGGLDLGLERAGMEVVWQVEKDEFCRKVLRKHWPNVTIHEDVHDVGKHNLKEVELICGGFPCPVVSSAAAGRNVGPWLWPEFARIIRDLRPDYVLVENVAGLLAGKLGLVLGDLAAIGYDAEWSCLPASMLGAPHKRARVWLVAYAHRYGESNRALNDEASVLSCANAPIWDWPNPPAYGGVDNGVPARVDRLRALGNAVVPQVAEWIGRRIIDAQQHTAECERTAT